ncbi:hypothetical protein TNCV_5114531 [Trichonephila clavipes]|nr:hypothetical protein TNCV_5114531 [Trichonephila clavipes]
MMQEGEMTSESLHERKAVQWISHSESALIDAYRECRLSFPYITRHTGRNPTTAMRIWNQWFAEDRAEWHAESSRLPMTNG